MKEIKQITTMSFPSDLGDHGILIAVCSDNQVWRKEYSDNYGWSNWVSMGGLGEEEVETEK